MCQRFLTARQERKRERERETHKSIAQFAHLQFGYVCMWKCAYRCVYHMLWYLMAQPANRISNRCENVSRFLSIACDCWMNLLLSHHRFLLFIQRPSVCSCAPVCVCIEHLHKNIYTLLESKNFVIVTYCCFDAIIVLSCFAFGLPILRVSSKKSDVIFFNRWWPNLRKINTFILFYEHTKKIRKFS